MKKRWPILMAVLGVSIAAGLMLSDDGAEVLYQGKPLSLWMDPYDCHSKQFSASGREAILALGTNAVPEIRKHLRRKDSRLKSLLFGKRFVDFRFLGLHWKSEHYTHIRAVAACRLLGPLAREAVPELVELIKREDHYCAPQETLAAFGVEPLTQLLTDDQPAIRASAAGTLATFTNLPIATTAALIKASSDPEERVRIQAVFALGAFDRQQPDLIPVFARSLSDPALFVRRAGMAGLLASKKGVTSAFPELAAATKDKDPDVAQMAARLLERINKTREGESR